MGAPRDRDRLGLPIAAHAHGVASIGDLVEAGFDTIEHCSFMTEDGIHPDEELIARMAASGVVVSLTVGMAPGGPPLPEAMLRQIAQFVDLLHAMRDAGGAHGVRQRQRDSRDQAA